MLQHVQNEVFSSSETDLKVDITKLAMVRVAVEAGLEADIATFVASLNSPWLLSPTSHTLSRAEREI